MLLDRQLEELEERIQAKLAPYQEQYELLQTIPGIKTMTAACIVAETGADMSKFETAKALCNWSGICPGNNRSAGKSKHSHIKKGNKFLLEALSEASWAAARTGGSIFQRKFHRRVKKMGKQKADVAIAHSLLRVVYAILKEGQPYQNQTPDPKHMHEMERAKLIRHHSKRLRQLGADEGLIAQMFAKLATQPSVCSSSEEKQTERAPSPTRIYRTTPAKACRGALGFRARQTRPQRYSVVREQAAGAPSQGRPKSKRTKPSPIQKPHIE